MTQNNADQLRARLKQTRADMPVADRQRGSLLLRARLYTWLATTRSSCLEAGLPPPAVIAGFWPLADEPDLSELYRQWHGDGIVVALPVMQTNQQSLAFWSWQPQAPMRQAGYGVQEPLEANPVDPDVILVPTLGYTQEGDRIGYGKGFYDRTLARLAVSDRRPTTIGVAWEQADLQALDANYRPAEHDHRLDAIITPSDWHPHAAQYRALA
jgi:5-formyltetrahydrofolate cyclo-ligase